MARVVEDLVLRYVRVIFVELSREDLEAAKEEGAALARNVRDVWGCDLDLDLRYTDNGDLVGSVEDHTVGVVLSRLLRDHLRAPFLDCTANEEPGYGLPGFSVYLNWDARSWCGRWMYSGAYGDWMDVVFALAPKEEAEVEAHQDRIDEWLSQEGRAVVILINDMVDP